MEKASITDRCTPQGPSPTTVASHHARGISQSQKQNRLTHVGVQVSPAPLNYWIRAMP